MTTPRIDYPIAGYGSWEASPTRSGGTYAHASAYVAAAHVSYAGPVRWRGTFTTPRLARGDSRAAAIMRVMHRISAGGVHLRIAVPGQPGAAARNAIPLAGPGTLLTVHPTIRSPARRDSHGRLGPWTVDWIEVIEPRNLLGQIYSAEAASFTVLDTVLTSIGPAASFTVLDTVLTS